MPRLEEIVEYLKGFAPLELAEEWDNVGLLIGGRNRDVARVMTCLTLTPEVAAEAVGKQVDLIVTHHPVLFRPVQRLTDETVEGRLVCDLIVHEIAVYSPHTAFDSTIGGINEWLADALQLSNVAALRPVDAESPKPPGGGRFGELPATISLTEFLALVKTSLRVAHVQYVGEETKGIRRVAVACGAAAEFLHEARHYGCDALLTGEARFHACLDAWNTDIALVLPGHYATERPAVERLADRIAAQFPEIVCAPSARESDPVKWSV